MRSDGSKYMHLRHRNRHSLSRTAAVPCHSGVVLSVHDVQDRDPSIAAAPYSHLGGRYVAPLGRETGTPIVCKTNIDQLLSTPDKGKGMRAEVISPCCLPHMQRQLVVKAELSSFKMCFGDDRKSLYKYYQNMYLV
jgi:hypothetical protein